MQMIRLYMTKKYTTIMWLLHSNFAYLTGKSHTLHIEKLVSCLTGFFGNIGSVYVLSQKGKLTVYNVQ